MFDVIASISLPLLGLLAVAALGPIAAAVYLTAAINRRRDAR
jgi:hypothetical protein